MREYLFGFCGGGGACDDGRLFCCLDTLRTPPGPGTGPLSDKLMPRPRLLFGDGCISSGSAANGTPGSSNPAV